MDENAKTLITRWKGHEESEKPQYDFNYKKYNKMAVQNPNTNISRFQKVTDAKYGAVYEAPR